MCVKKQMLWYKMFGHPSSGEYLWQQDVVWGLVLK